MSNNLPVVLAAALLLFGCSTSSTEDLADPPATYDAFSAPVRVQINGYDGDAMEPFLSRDGRFLFFNNRNDPSINTDLYVAERIDSLTFDFLGSVDGANTPALEGVPTLDTGGTLYFVSTRTYDETYSTLYRGRFSEGSVSGVELVPGVSRQEPGIVNFDVEVSPDGSTLYFVDARFGDDGPEAADLVIARRTADGFERASNTDALLRHINTDALEYAASISSDGREMFFTRARSITSGESPAIYRTSRDETGVPFDPAQRVSAMDGFVEGPTFSPDDRAVFYHKRENDRFVLYRVSR
jgi:Tol biopolymer transport system component